MGFFKKLFGGLKKTAGAITGGIAAIFTGGTELDDDFYDDLTAVLLAADIGMAGTEIIIDDIKHEAKKNGIKTQDELKIALAESIGRLLTAGNPDPDNQIGNNSQLSAVNFQHSAQTVLLIVGVNGVGKTTAIGKMAAYFKAQNKSVLLCAGDTFRAAASEQLSEWATRAKVRIVKHGEGADPAAVVFDALSSARAKGDDLAIIDTAGRLHNKAHLMEELKKIDRIVARVMGDKKENDYSYKKLLVIDATTGQNALAQVEYFNSAVRLDGIILTKLDGTAKGGVVVAIKQQFNIPVVFVGIGEKIDDLLPFDAQEFANGIVGIEG